MAEPGGLCDVFEGVGQKAGLEIWQIDDNVRPVRVSRSCYGVFFSGCAYVIVATRDVSGSLHHDIHCWLGEDTSQAEAQVAGDACEALHSAFGSLSTLSLIIQSEGRLSDSLPYFRPCAIFRVGKFTSDAEEHKSCLYEWNDWLKVLQEVGCDRASLNHNNIFVLDTATKIFQFNGSNTTIRKRTIGQELVQYIKNIFHDGKCDIVVIEDGKLITDGDTKEFWGLLGGFAPFPSKFSTEDVPTRLFGVVNGQAKPVDVDSWKRDLLDTHKCYLLDNGLDVFVWMGINSPLEERKNANVAAEDLLHSFPRPKTKIIRVVEGFERIRFRSEFVSWPELTDVVVSEDSKGEVAGVNVEGLLKAPSSKEEPQAYIDCTGILQVWRLDGDTKSPLMGSDISKFYSGDCYTFIYTYLGELGEEYLVGTWFGQQSLEEDKISATSEARKMVESLKFLPVRVCMYEGNETIQFFSIFQSFIVYKGGVCNGYKKYIAHKGLPDVTYSEDGLALFRVQGIGPKNMQAIQVEAVASSLNSSYCYILHNGSSIFTWFGHSTTSQDHERVERLLDMIKPNVHAKPEMEGSESEKFWDSLGGKLEYPSQQVAIEVQSEACLFACSFSKDFSNLQVQEMDGVYLDYLTTEEIFILFCQLDTYVWVGQEASSKMNVDALTIGKKFLENKFLFKKLFPIFIIMEGSEPKFFRRFFKRSEPLIRQDVISTVKSMSSAVRTLETYVEGDEFQKEMVEFALDRNLLKLFFADQDLKDLPNMRKHVRTLMKGIKSYLGLLSTTFESDICLKLPRKNKYLTLAEEAIEFVKLKSKKPRPDEI